MRQLVIEACESRFDILCSDVETGDVIGCVFRDLLGASAVSGAAKTYEIGRHGSSGSWTVAASDGSRHTFDTPADLLFHLDKDITIALQRLRPDLLFLHGAVLVWRGRAVVLSAPAGTGKSTFTLAALHHGLDFFSDELAPIDLHDLTVHPYRRAVHLKSLPPSPYSVPRETIFCGTRCYVPAPASSNDVHRRPARIVAMVFLRREGSSPGLRHISPASGAARVMANALNLLAHPAVGLDAAIALGDALPCFEVDVTDLGSAIAGVKQFLCSRHSDQPASGPHVASVKPRRFLVNTNNRPWNDEDTYWRENYRNRPYATSDREYDYYQPAYRFGYEATNRYPDRNWNDIESNLSGDWNTYEHRGTSTWEQMKDAVRDAWDRVTGHRPVGAR